MPLSRRLWIARMLGFATAAWAGRALPLLGGCAPSEPPPPDPVLRLKISDIPAAGRMELKHLRVPVELRREGETVLARSLLCTHQRCHVEWQAEERRFRCPCHEGLFAEDGSVVYGPPTRPLQDLEVVRRGDEVHIDTRQVYNLPEPETIPQDS